jgi:hypothetical protein
VFLLFRKRCSLLFLAKVVRYLLDDDSSLFLKLSKFKLIKLVATVLLVKFQ